MTVKNNNQAPISRTKLRHYQAPGTFAHGLAHAEAFAGAHSLGLSLKTSRLPSDAKSYAQS
jgi:hypothetical protein